MHKGIRTIEEKNWALHQLPCDAAIISKSPKILRWKSFNAFDTTTGYARNVGRHNTVRRAVN